jgi:hypothetical protein
MAGMNYLQEKWAKDPSSSPYRHIDERRKQLLERDKAEREKKPEGVVEGELKQPKLPGTMTPRSAEADPLQDLNNWLRSTIGLAPPVRVVDRGGKDVFGEGGGKVAGVAGGGGAGTGGGTGGGGTGGGGTTQLPETKAADGKVSGAPGTGGAFTQALEKLESDFSNNPPPINDKNARAGTPSKGFFQIIDPTWRRYAPKDVLEKYPSADLAPHDVQEAVARRIPLNQFGPRTVAGLQKQFGGKLDTSKTIGELADQISGGGGGGVAPVAGGGRVTVDPGKAAGVSPELVAAQKAGMEAALPPGYSAVMTSGKRGDNRGSQHFSGNAADWQIKGPDGQLIANRGNDPTGIYHKFQLETLAKLYRDNPDLAKWYASGEYFETKKGSGLRDPMHGDFGGPRATPGYGDPQAIHREAKRLNEQRAMQAQQPPPPSPVPVPGPESPASTTYNNGGNRTANLNATTNINVGGDQTTSVSMMDELMRRNNADMVRNLSGALA